MPSLPRLLLTALAVTAALPATALGAPASVSVAAKAFGPNDVSVAPGDTVTWNWGDGTHNVHAISGPETFDSGFKTAGATFSRQLNLPGTYTYQCDAHPSMRGTVTVAGPAPAAAPSAISAVKVSTLAVVRLSASAPGTLAIRILRGAHAVRTTTAPLAAGVNRVPLTVRGLKRGRYRVRLLATTSTGQRSAPVVRPLVVSRAVLARKVVAAKPAPAAAPAPTVAPPADDHGGERSGKSDGVTPRAERAS